MEAWWRHAQGEAFAGMSPSTSAYCQARARLDLQTLELIAGLLAWNLERRVLEDERPLGKRPVKIVDGTMLSIAGARPRTRPCGPRAAARSRVLAFRP